MIGKARAPGNYASDVASLGAHVGPGNVSGRRPMLLALGDIARIPGDHDGIASGLAGSNQLPPVITLPRGAIVNGERIAAVGLKRKALDLLEFAANETL